MKQQEMRQIAIRVARSNARQTDRHLETLSAGSALKILDDIKHIDSEVIAAIWYKNASDNQIKLFSQEWKQW